MSAESTYIVAGSKPWNQHNFEAARHEHLGQWLFASNALELDDLLTRTTPRYVFFLHWNWRVPASVWQTNECVCFHMTDVPYGRGGSPLQNLIAAGHRNTVVSALRMVEDLDAGPVYTKRPLSLDGRAEEIYERAGTVCVDIIRWMVDTEPAPVEQSGEVVQFKRRVPAQSVLPAEGSLSGLYDHIRMLDAPTYPAAFLEHGAFRLEFTQALSGNDKIVAQVVIRRRADKE